ncbi:helix-turn-helix domain-containing protein [[Kitasatospora] papulosa]
MRLIAFRNRAAPPSAPRNQALPGAHWWAGNRPSYSTLGRAAGVSRSYISRILSGERTPSWEVTLKSTFECGGDPDPCGSLSDGATDHEPASWHRDRVDLAVATEPTARPMISRSSGHAVSGGSP